MNTPCNTPQILPAIRPSDDEEKAPEKPDPKSILADCDLRVSRAHTEIEEARRDAVKWNIQTRKRFATIIVMITICWLGFVATIIVLSATRESSVFSNLFWPNRYRTYLEVSDSVLIALITTATATIVGLFVIVAVYFFPKGGALISGRFDGKQQSTDSVTSS